MSRWRLELCATCVVAAGWLGWAAEVSAQTQPLTFTFTRVRQVHCDEGFGEACPNDFYPKVEIDNQGLDDGKDRFCCAHGTDFLPNWVFTRNVDVNKATVNISVELWDQDDASADDKLRIDTGFRNVSVVVSLNRCTWDAGSVKGDVNGEGKTTGSGNDSAEIFFRVDSPLCLDTDNDGLFDHWETRGFDTDGNGTVDVNLPAMGAHKDRRDLFLELDYVAVPGGHTHAPLQGAVRQVVQAFANAPVGNIDGTAGIQLHIDLGALYGAGNVISVAGPGGVTGTFGDFGGGGNAFNEAGNTIVDWDGATGSTATNFFTLKNLNTNRELMFRYGLFVHQTNLRAAVNDCTSGWEKGVPGVNMIISLGGVSTAGTPCWGADATGQSVGTQDQQAGTLMHEFGHLLGLSHGGNDGVNNKPNYLSVMSYAFQPCSVTTITPTIPGRCDYSRLLMPDASGLNENSLDECRNIDGGALGLGPVDWNAAGGIQGATCTPPSANVTANLNGDFVDANGNGSQDPGEATLSVLNGHQDWGALVYNFRKIPNFQTGGAPSAQEPNPEDIARARAVLAEKLRPGLVIDKIGPADARPGDTLSYTLAIENSLTRGGRGPALNVSVVDTKPDGSTQTFDIGRMLLGASTTRTLDIVVPCATKDAVVLTNRAAASALDLANNTVTAADAVSTTIHAPVMVLSVTATTSVNAGEPITYTITWQNTGSAPASAVTITDTVAADVYYSEALDKGAGPRPNHITLNPDGTRTLVWNIGAVPAASAARSLSFTARPTLLASGGTSYMNTATLTHRHGVSCVADPVSASASSTIAVAPLDNDGPKGSLLWKIHVKKDDVDIETLARILATDQRFDGRDKTAPNGVLVSAELKPVFRNNLLATIFRRDHRRPARLERELLTLYFNLAARRLNADTLVNAKFHPLPGVTTVRDLALHVQATLATPYDRVTSRRYKDALKALEELND
jgi:uncharacterized repeat protein (TIGR01451 family)